MSIQALTFREKICRGAFWAASSSSDPICRSHELFRRIQVVDSLDREAWAATRLFKKALFCFALVGYALTGVCLAAPGLGFRAFAAGIQEKPFLFEQGSSPAKTLPPDRSFSMLSWNVCCVGGGYPLSDGGVMPWIDRIDAVVKKALEPKADLVCLYETFDLQPAFKLAQAFREAGYSYIYYNIGQRAIGASSGMFVASKYRIAYPKYTPFPQELLIGRTKHAAKGIFSFDLESSEGAPFARILTTHLQHSEEPAFPTPQEIEARKGQMKMVADEALALKDRCVVVTGDLNLDDEEARNSSWKDLFEKGDLFQEKTWGGDAFCAWLTGKSVSKPLNLDHTMLLKGTAQSITTTLTETGYDASRLKRDALSDHRGLLSKIMV